MAQLEIKLGRCIVDIFIRGGVGTKVIAWSWRSFFRSRTFCSGSGRLTWFTAAIQILCYHSELVFLTQGQVIYLGIAEPAIVIRYIMISYMIMI